MLCPALTSQYFRLSRQLPTIPATITDPLQRLEADLVETLPSELDKTQITEIELLAGMRTLASDKLLTALASASSESVRGSAYLALLRLSDYSVLGEVGKFLQENLHNARMEGLRGRMYQSVSEISDAKDPAILAQNESFSQSSDHNLRAAAVKALRRILNPESVRFLIPRLDDSDVGTRYDAVMALALEGKGLGWAPAYELFLKDPRQYVNQWKQWWRVDGRQKYSVKDAQLMK
jgi:HEAT repeat protein